MSSVNKAFIVGNVGKDPELRYATSGLAVVTLNVATSHKKKSKQTGESMEDTQWHRVVFYDKLAEIVGQYVKKGMRLFIEGRITYRTYTDKQGIEKVSTEIIAAEMQMLGGEKASEYVPPESTKPVQDRQKSDDFADDIPF